MDRRARDGSTRYLRHQEAPRGITIMTNVLRYLHPGLTCFEWLSTPRITAKSEIDRKKMPQWTTTALPCRPSPLRCTWLPQGNREVGNVGVRLRGRVAAHRVAAGASFAVHNLLHKPLSKTDRGLCKRNCWVGTSRSSEPQSSNRVRRCRDSQPASRIFKPDRILAANSRCALTSGGGA